MKYRIIKKPSWWTTEYDTGMPMFLYYDFDLEHFEVGAYQSARNGKWTFTRSEATRIAKDYDLNEEFFIETVREKGDKI